MNQRKINLHLRRLAKLDDDVARGLEQHRFPAPRIREPGFRTLASTIVAQKISTESAAAILGRLQALVPDMDPRALLALPTDSLREAGLSYRKIEYLQGLALAIVEQRFDPAALAQMGDEDAIGAITELRGFGRWSAEIYLMFSLQRSDIFPAGDLAIRIALQKLKGLEQSLNEKQARELVESWAPYRSAGSLFLWHYYRGAPT